MAENGSDILVLVNTGTVGAPAWTAAGSQRGVTFDESVAMIDVSNKNDGAPRKIKPGRYAASLSLDALYVPDDASQIALKAAFRSRSAVQVMRSEHGVNIESATGYISAYSESDPDMAESTVSITVDIDGEWTAEPS
jgi:TP901-1 family phage major tail protein